MGETQVGAGAGPLEGKAALVTGASSGLGRATAITLAGPARTSRWWPGAERDWRTPRRMSRRSAAGRWSSLRTWQSSPSTHSGELEQEAGP